MRLKQVFFVSPQPPGRGSRRPLCSAPISDTGAAPPDSQDNPHHGLDRRAGFLFTRTHLVGVLILALFALGNLILFLQINIEALIVTTDARVPLESKKLTFRHNVCVAVMGYTQGNLTSIPAREMIGIMQTYARNYSDSVFFMLDSQGGDSNSTAEELCKAGRFPTEQCYFMGDLHCHSSGKRCLVAKLIAAFDTLRTIILNDCRFFIRADSDEYLYLPSMEQWLDKYPNVDSHRLVFGQVRGSKYASRYAYSFPGGSSLFSRPAIEKMFRYKEWDVAQKSLAQVGIAPTDDDMFIGFVLGYCDYDKSTKIAISPGDIILGGPSGVPANLKRWRDKVDKHCAWKIHKIHPDNFEEFHNFYVAHASQYNASVHTPSVCRERLYENIKMFTPGVEDRLCNNSRISIQCKDFIEQEPPSLPVNCSDNKTT